MLLLKYVILPPVFLLFLPHQFISFLIYLPYYRQSYTSVGHTDRHPTHVHWLCLHPTFKVSFSFHLFILFHSPPFAQLYYLFHPSFLVLLPLFFSNLFFFKSVVNYNGLATGSAFQVDVTFPDANFRTNYPFSVAVVMSVFIFPILSFDFGLIFYFLFRFQIFDSNFRFPIFYFDFRVRSPISSFGFNFNINLRFIWFFLIVLSSVRNQKAQIVPPPPQKSISVLVNRFLPFFCSYENLYVLFGGTQTAAYTSFTVTVSTYCM